MEKKKGNKSKNPSLGNYRNKSSTKIEIYLFFGIQYLSFCFKSVAVTIQKFKYADGFLLLLLIKKI